MMEATGSTTPNAPERAKITIEDLRIVGEFLARQTLAMAMKTHGLISGGYNAFNDGDYVVKFDPNKKFEPILPNLLRTATQ